jgi:hypothetical protein
MKKTLVALAVLAASGASFAQVTLSGEFAYGYLATTSGSGATASGGGLDTAQLVFQAGEDLGGGNRVDVTFKTDGTGSRGGSLVNDDQIIALTTGLGKITAGSWKPGDWLQGVTGYAVWYGLDGRVLSGRTLRDSIGIAIPLGGGLTISATNYEPAANPKIEPLYTLGEGSGNAGTSMQQSNVYTLNYKTGAASVSVGYVTYNNITDGSDATAKNVARIGGNYDFGVAKLGAGVSTVTYAGTATGTQSLVSLSVPLGAVSLNAGWAANNISSDAGSAQVAGNRTGYMLGAQYNLSKRTYAILNYGSWQAAIGDSQNANLSALTLVHDF